MIKALKPISFAGQTFGVGDAIPEALIHPHRIESLIQMGLIKKDNTMPQNIGGVSVEHKVEIKEVYDPDKLKQASKAELTGIAEGLGIDTTGMNKAQIVDAITADNA